MGGPFAPTGADGPVGRTGGHRRRRSEAKGSWTFDARDLMPRQSRVTAPALTIAAEELLERDARYPARAGSFLDAKWWTKQPTVVGSRAGSDDAVLFECPDLGGR